MEKLEEYKAERVIKARNNRKQKFENDIKRIEDQMTKTTLRSYQYAQKFKEKKDQLVISNIIDRKRKWKLLKDIEKKLKNQ